MTESKIGDGTAFLEEARRRLANTAWSVSLEPLPDGFSLNFDHPLSVLFGMGVLPSPISGEEMFERTFAKREFEVIANAPQNEQVWPLLRDLRTLTLTPRVGEKGVVMVARVLAQHGVLTEEESDWLAWAGKPWDARPSLDSDAP